MLIKNKIYSAIIILLFLVDLIIITNENLISNFVIEKIFYLLMFLICTLIFIGVSVTRKH
ncbi:hypothetical protein CD149_08685 [Staphylococcus condimenti]|nr:hypothetical protein A4G25_09025 [Staphylococcus condimenti]APR59935.1 hypothetical protein BTZ13_01420 [Staphylococcus condimenti]PNZ59435.1 hypothetical protein CD149_08685 [Staphylococcus condimenti]